MVEDRAAFEFRYGHGLPVAGAWSGGLSNQSETLTLLSYRDDVIQQFAYHDSDFWPGRADGTGSSLEVIRTAGNYDDSDNWQPSVDFGGSPGRAGSVRPPVVINEVLAHTDPPTHATPIRSSCSIRPRIPWSSAAGI